MFSLPKSWSELTWPQLVAAWQTKMRYGDNPDVARVAALVALLQTPSPQTHPRPLPSGRGEGWRVEPYADDPVTGEKRYLLSPKASLPSRGDLEGSGRGWLVTPRELSQMAKQALQWFDFPYGDRGEEEEKDEKGKVIKERREAVHGYVNPVSDWHDALELPIEQLRMGKNGQWTMDNGRWWRKLLRTFHFSLLTSKTFALPQVACYNYTWEQYRTLQNIASNLFREGMSEAEVLDLHAQFLAHALTPRSFAILETTGGSIRLRPHWEYTYNAARAEGMMEFWRKRLRPEADASGTAVKVEVTALFHICFQAYQTAVSGYYATAYPLLFGSSGKSDTMTDALKSESRTINAVMRRAGYTEQQQVYDSNLPFVLDILNDMSEEAKQIEQLNARIKSKK